jgi:uncharacterized protein YkwD
MGFKLIKSRVGVANVNERQQQKEGKTRRWFVSLIGDNKQTSSEEVKKVMVLGGKYLSKKAQSLRSVDTVDSTENDASENYASWKSCSRTDFYRQSSPLSDEEKQKEWGKAISDARRLPRTGQYINNHILVNQERCKRVVHALKRSRELDAVARWHAEIMASEGVVRHSDPSQLQAMLEDSGTCLGENVASGDSVQMMHREMIKNVSDLRNMTDRRYKEMGMATAKGENGEIYLCQVFRG